MYDLFATLTRFVRWKLNETLDIIRNKNKTLCRQFIDSELMRVQIRSMWAKTHQSFYSCNQIFRSQTQTNRSLADRFVCIILKFQERNANFSVLELFHFGTCRSWFVKYYIISSVFRCAFSHILSIHRIFEVCICFSRIDGVRIFVSIYDNRDPAVSMIFLYDRKYGSSSTCAWKSLKTFLKTFYRVLK